MADEEEEARCPYCAVPGAIKRRAPLPALPSQLDRTSKKRVRLADAACVEEPEEVATLLGYAMLQGQLVEKAKERAIKFSCDARDKMDAYKSALAAGIAEFSRLGNEALRLFAAEVAAQEKAMDGDLDARLNSVDLFQFGSRSGDLPFMRKITNVGVAPLLEPVLHRVLPDVSTILTAVPVPDALRPKIGSDEHILEVIRQVTTWMEMMAVFNLMDILSMTVASRRAFPDAVVIECAKWLETHSQTHDSTAVSNPDFHAFSFMFLILYADKLAAMDDDFVSCLNSLFIVQQGKHLSAAMTSVHCPKLEALILAYATELLFEVEESVEDEESDQDDETVNRDFTTFRTLASIVKHSRLVFGLKHYEPAFVAMEKLMQKYNYEGSEEYAADMGGDLLDVYLSPLGRKFIAHSSERAESAMNRLADMLIMTQTEADFDQDLSKTFGVKLFEVYHLLSQSTGLKKRLQPGSGSVYQAAMGLQINFLQHYLNVPMKTLEGTNAHVVVAQMLDLVRKTTRTSSKTPKMIRQLVGCHLHGSDWEEEHDEDDEDEEEEEDEDDGEAEL